MNNRPDLANYAMSMKNRILIKTIMEMADKFKIVRCGLEMCSWSKITCIPRGGGPEYPHYILTRDEWVEIMELASAYVAAHPKLEWLSTAENQYVSEYGFQCSKDEKKRFWNTIASGASDYMSDWHIWRTELRVNG